MKQNENKYENIINCKVIFKTKNEYIIKKTLIKQAE